MAQIISIHSFRGGTGKSNITANLATLLAAAGQRVGVVDTDIQSPGIHIVFGLDEADMTYALNDYLWGACDIKATAYDVTPGLGEAFAGHVFLIPSSIKPGQITRVLRASSCVPTSRIIRALASRWRWRRNSMCRVCC